MAPQRKGELILTAEVHSIVRNKTDVIAEAKSNIIVEAADRSVAETVNDAAIALVTHPVVQFFGAGLFLAGLAYLWRSVRGKSSAT